MASAMALGALALLGCDGAAPAADAGPAANVAPFAPQPVRLRRITQSQYANAIHDLFGDAVVVTRALEPDVAREHSLAVGASETSISPRGTEQYQTSAFEVAEQVLRDPTRRAAAVTCAPANNDDAACATTFVRAVGRRVWRRALTDDEVTRLAALATRAGGTLGDFHRGLEYALSAMLQAPDFLFRAELGAGGRYRGYDLASRLSFFLWDSAPDDALLDAAQDGSLDGPDGLAREVDRMLASPKARRGLRAFVTDWLDLASLDELSKDARVFPSFSADLGPSAREEALRVAEDLAFDRDADFRDLLTTRETFVNRRLAALYGVQFPVRDAPVTQFARVTLPTTQPRRGLLGMAAFLALRAHPVSSSPTLRGRFIREALLCYQIAMPPVNVNTAIPEPSATRRTLRERLGDHATAPSCRGCHSIMDPIGLGLEHFDGVGRYRDTDDGAPLDTSGVLDRVPFGDAAQLGQALHDHPDLPRCLVARVYRHAWGYVEADGQLGEVDRLRARFAQSGYKLRGLLRDIALGDAFTRAGAVAQDGGL